MPSHEWLRKKIAEEPDDLDCTIGPTMTHEMVEAFLKELRERSEESTSNKNVDLCDK